MLDDKDVHLFSSIASGNFSGTIFIPISSRFPFSIPFPLKIRNQLPFPWHTLRNSRFKHTSTVLAPLHAYKLSCSRGTCLQSGWLHLYQVHACSKMTWLCLFIFVGYTPFIQCIYQFSHILCTKPCVWRPIHFFHIKDLFVKLFDFRIV